MPDPMTPAGSRAAIFAELLKEPISEAYARELLATNERLAAQVRKLREELSTAPRTGWGRPREARVDALLKETEPSE